MKAYHQKTYIRKGYNQKAENNNRWKGGIGIFRRLIPIEVCSQCGSTKNLCVHHKDENRYNNDVANLICLCKRCHQITHNCYSNLPAKEVVGAARKKFIEEHRDEVFDENGKFKKICKV